MTQASAAVVCPVSAGRLGSLVNMADLYKTACACRALELVPLVCVCVPTRLSVRWSLCCPPPLFCRVRRSVLPAVRIALSLGPPCPAARARALHGASGSAGSRPLLQVRGPGSFRGDSESERGWWPPQPQAQSAEAALSVRAVLRQRALVFQTATLGPPCLLSSSASALITESDRDVFVTPSKALLLPRPGRLKSGPDSA